jgi:hypothetical protein
MRVELFIHAGSRDAPRLITPQLTRHFGALPLEVNVIDGSDLQQSLRMGSRYSKLLRASVAPEIDLSVEQLDWLGARIYVRLQWYSFSGLRYGVPYYSLAEASFLPEEFDLFFPAVAIRDQMVLLPEGHKELLQRIPRHALLASAFQQHIVEADFRDKAKLTKAIKMVARQFNSQLTQELLAWQTRRPRVDDIDIRQAAIDLDVDLAILNKVARNRERKAQTLYSHLSCELSPTELPCGKSKRVQLTITNSSKRTISGLAYSIRGPVVVNAPRVLLEVPARRSVTTELALQAKSEGEFPIEIVLASENDMRTQGAYGDILPFPSRSIPIWLTAVPL